MILLANEPEFLAHVKQRQDQDRINDDPNNVPNSYPCWLVDEHYGKSGSGWWRWTFTFIYVAEAIELLEAAGYVVAAPPIGNNHETSLDSSGSVPAD